MRNRLLLSTFLLTASSLANAQSPLPPEMDGRWTNTGSNHSNKIEVELVRMESPTVATIKVVWWPYCRWAETKAEFIEGDWIFSPQNCANNTGALTITARLRPVEGKKRLEGMFTSSYDSGGSKTVYLEW